MDWPVEELRYFPLVSVRLGLVVALVLLGLRSLFLVLGCGGA
jgi:hypothetical protein